MGVLFSQPHKPNNGQMIPTPRWFTYLDTVARVGSIRKAADTLNVASTAINRMIIELEEQIGTPLFERLPRGVRLTAAGELLVGAVRRNISDLGSVASQIEQLRGLVRGQVKIACSESVADDLVPTVIAKYQTRHRGVQFGNTASLVEALLAYDTDLFLAHDPPPSEGIARLLAVMQPRSAMVRSDHPMSGLDSVAVADLRSYPI